MRVGEGRVGEEEEQSILETEFGWELSDGLMVMLVLRWEPWLTIPWA